MHLGYLTYDVEKESVRIPNKEVAQEYINAISTMDWKEVISQIKDKKYPDSIQNYAGNVLLVGINYSKKEKKHECVIEEYLKK